MVIGSGKLRSEGEGKAGPTKAWVQPPGTPNVGMAYLTAFQLTGDPVLLEAARETARETSSNEIS